MTKTEKLEEVKENQRRNIKFMISQNDIIKFIMQKKEEDVIKEYDESKIKLTARDVQEIYHLTKGFKLAIYEVAKKYFDENIINNGEGLKPNQKGLNFQGYQRLIAMTYIRDEDYED